MSLYFSELNLLICISEFYHKTFLNTVYGFIFLNV